MISTGLQPDFKRLVDEFIREATQRTKWPLFVVSGYRKPGAKVANAIVRPARRSQHALGLAVDLGFRGYRASQINPDAWEWLGTQWEALGREFRWGGRFTPRDVVHFDVKV